MVSLGRKQNPYHLILNSRTFISPNHPERARQIKSKTHFYFHDIVKYNAMDDIYWQIEKSA